MDFKQYCLLGRACLQTHHRPPSNPKHEKKQQFVVEKVQSCRKLHFYNTYTSIVNFLKSKDNNNKLKNLDITHHTLDNEILHGFENPPFPRVIEFLAPPFSDHPVLRVVEYLAEKE